MNNPGANSCNCGCGGTAGHEALLNLPGLDALQYRFGTHGSLKRDMLRSLSGAPALARFTTRKDDDLSIGLVDAWATVLDVLSFYQERIINEGYLRTATDRFSIVELARHISYRLRPGVAAGGFLSFQLNEAPGAPPTALVPAGTKVQSIPGQNELPQLFETSASIEARVEWNALRLQTRRFVAPAFGDTSLYLEGTATGLQPGDTLLIIGDERLGNTDSEQWDFRRLLAVQPDPKLNRTRVSWQRGLGISPTGKNGTPAVKNIKVFALRQKAALFGYNAPDFRSMAESVKDAFLPDASNENNSHTDWSNFSISGISGGANLVHLDNVYPRIQAQSWVVLSRDGYEEVYRVVRAAESSRKDFTLATKTMALELSGENLHEQFEKEIRGTTVYAQSEELAIAATPVDDAIQNDVRVRLERLVQGLNAGMPVAISGRRRRLQITTLAKNLSFSVEGNATASRKLAPGDSLIILRQPAYVANGKQRWTLLDNAGFTGTVEMGSADWSAASALDADPVVSEIHMIKELIAGQDPTQILLQQTLQHVYDNATVTVNANVVAATHGETKEETLGSGNGSAAFQRFMLKQKPLTYISAATASGTASTLQVRVNDILWQEVPTLYDAGPRDKVYTTIIADNGTVTVQFGDGRTGARLPTGTENVRATYRIGTGTEGMLKAGQLSMLMTPQLGVTKVANPIPTTGAANPEPLDKARTNAPLTVLTLDRIVSAKDFQDYARAFAGVGKSIAEVLWNGEQQIMHITIAAEDGPIPHGSSLYANLVNAINAAAHPHINISVSDYELLHFSVNLRIRTDPAYLFERVQDAVTQALRDRFSFAVRSFGQSVSPSEVLAVVQGVPGVVYADLDLLDGQDPFASENFRLPSLVARWSGTTILPAQLLLVDPEQITVSAI